MSSTAAHGRMVWKEDQTRAILRCLAVANADMAAAPAASWPQTMAAFAEAARTFSPGP